ncbi:Response regulator receiver domain-containing protein [Verrucomicrobium sp. GAS474]|uniref:response regulator n=1 Tax=Verrucomicrobium sp. GAS474 TaxID=1882831 RepID=UPI00087D8892|nr:response regulator [Verrucomicrobium sp. GAS474]SDT97043.1 Response regulator receiver domain-containing protein [Verrucomicrobium sp. GAS474]
MTILLIEDEEGDLKLVTRILAHEGHRIIGVHSAEEAIDLLDADREHPEVILTDLRLPRMDGVTLARHLKADPKTAAIPVAAMSSHIESYTVAEMIAAGFALILPKPLSGRTLPQQLVALLA